MKKKNVLALFLLTAVIGMTACGKDNKKQAADPAPAPVTENPNSEETSEPAAPTPVSAKKMFDQGNPTTVTLGEFAESTTEGFKTWIKVSTQFDPAQSMYDSSSLPAGAKGIIADFTVEGLEAATTIYWNYMLVSGEDTISVWDTSSTADTLTITEDGSYRLVFNAETVLGGPIDEINSLQFVVPCSGEDCTTKITVTKLTAITDSADFACFTTGVND